MSNVIYAKAKEALLSGSINMTTDTIKAVLVDADLYAINATTDQFLSSIAAGARVATSSALASKTVTGGVFDAADVTLTGVSGAQSEAIAIYKDTGTASTSPLIAYIDTGTGLPITPNSGDIIIQWSNGTSKIFAL